MGTSTSWAQLDAKLERLARDYADLPGAQVKEGTLIVKKSVESFMPSRLRGAGKKGAPLNVRSVTAGSGDSADGRVWVTGPAQLIESDTRAHLIVPSGARGLGAGRKSRHKAAASLLSAGPTLGGLKIGFGKGAVLKIGDGFAAYARHPGTKGKHPWAKGVEAAVPAVTRLFEVKADLALRRIF